MDCREALPHLPNDSVDIVYLDPPYNTNNTSFGYQDNHQENKWQTFMTEIINQVHRVMRPSACLFISIDDNQMHVLKHILHNIFGSHNHLGTMITRQATRSNAKHINTIHEYVLCYAKNKSKCPPFHSLRINGEQGAAIREIIDTIKQTESTKQERCTYLKQIIKEKINSENATTWQWLRNYCNVDENGNIYATGDLSVPCANHNHQNDVYTFEYNGQQITLPPLNKRKWQSVEFIEGLGKQGLLVFKDAQGYQRPYKKRLLADATDSAMSILNFYSRQGTHDLQNELGKDVAKHFATPKPKALIAYLLNLSKHHYDKPTVLDCFGGSGTTALACEQVYPNGNWILMQNDEPCVQPNDKFQTIADVLQYRLKNQQNIKYDVYT